MVQPCSQTSENWRGPWFLAARMGIPHTEVGPSEVHSVISRPGPCVPSMSLASGRSFPLGLWTLGWERSPLLSGECLACKSGFVMDWSPEEAVPPPRYCQGTQL